MEAVKLDLKHNVVNNLQVFILKKLNSASQDKENYVFAENKIF